MRAAERGIALALRRVDPWIDAALRAINPLAKVPPLVTPDGVLFETAVICEYLDGLGQGRRLIPPPGPARVQALLVQGATDGAMTAMGRLFALERRGTGARDPMPARFAAAREATLDWLEGQPLAEGPGIGEIAVGCLLGYLEFRWPERSWGQGHVGLARWYAMMAARPVMTESLPHTGCGVALMGGWAMKP